MSHLPCLSVWGKDRVEGHLFSPRLIGLDEFQRYISDLTASIRDELRHGHCAWRPLCRG